LCLTHVRAPESFGRCCGALPPVARALRLRTLAASGHIVAPILVGDECPRNLIRSDPVPRSPFGEDHVPLLSPSTTATSCGRHPRGASACRAKPPRRVLYDLFEVAVAPRRSPRPYGRRRRPSWCLPPRLRDPTRSRHLAAIAFSCPRPRGVLRRPLRPAASWSPRATSGPQGLRHRLRPGPRSWWWPPRPPTRASSARRAWPARRLFPGAKVSSG